MKALLELLEMAQKSTVTAMKARKINRPSDMYSAAVWIGETAHDFNGAKFRVVSSIDNDGQRYIDVFKDSEEIISSWVPSISSFKRAFGDFIWLKPIIKDHANAVNPKIPEGLREYMNLADLYVI